MKKIYTFLFALVFLSAVVVAMPVKKMWVRVSDCTVVLTEPQVACLGQDSLLADFFRRFDTSGAAGFASQELVDEAISSDDIEYVLGISLADNDDQRRAYLQTLSAELRNKIMQAARHLRCFWAWSV